jgi:hypothetical protein
MDEAGAVHALDDGEHVRLAQSMHQLGEPVQVRRNRSRADQRPVAAAGVPIEALTTEVESSVDLHLSLLGVATDGRTQFLGEALPHHIRTATGSLKSAAALRLAARSRHLADRLVAAAAIREHSASNRRQLLRQCQREPIAAMRLRVTDPALVPELVEFLQARLDVVAAQVGDDEVEVSLLGSYSNDAMRMELYLRVRAWEAGRIAGGATAEIVD